MQFIKFGIVGASNTIIGYLIYLICIVIFRRADILAGYDYYAAQFIMYVISVLWSFYWNNKYVFKQSSGEHRNILKALAKTYLSYAFTGIFLSEILMFLWVGKLGISAYIAPAINLCITVPLNFLIQKYWAFGKVKKE